MKNSTFLFWASVVVYWFMTRNLTEHTYYSMTIGLAFGFVAGSWWAFTRSDEEKQ